MLRWGTEGGREGKRESESERARERKRIRGEKIKQNALSHFFC